MNYNTNIYPFGVDASWFIVSEGAIAFSHWLFPEQGLQHQISQVQAKLEGELTPKARVRWENKLSDLQESLAAIKQPLLLTGSVQGAIAPEVLSSEEAIDTTALKTAEVIPF